MSWTALLLAAAAIATALPLLALWLRRARMRDAPMGPRAGPKHLPPAELDRLTALVGRGEEAQVRRRLAQAGYDERRAGRLIWWMRKVAEADASE
jgi:hypothetical protein